MAIIGNPLLGAYKHGPFILGAASLRSEDNPFESLRNNISSLEKDVMSENEEKEGILIPFTVIPGGKMQEKFRHHLDTPLITTILVTHSGDVHLLKRAVNSILAQEMDLKLFELLIYFDGVPTKKESDIIEDATGQPLISLLYNCQLHHPTEKNGYYCVGRNRTTPLAQGLYIYNMDADNEIAPSHLPSLLKAIRTPDKHGFPHFVYSRRKYIVDKGVENPPTKDGSKSKYVPWTPKNLAGFAENPQRNFIDTGDFLISKSVLYRLSDTTGCIWNSQCRRFGDWDLMVRMLGSGMRGHALDQTTNLYHWTGNNLQVTRNLSDIIMLPESIYDDMVEKGMVIDS